MAGSVINSVGCRLEPWKMPGGVSPGDAARHEGSQVREMLAHDTERKTRPTFCGPSIVRLHPRTVDRLQYDPFRGVELPVTIEQISKPAQRSCLS